MMVRGSGWAAILDGLRANKTWAGSGPGIRAGAGSGLEQGGLVQGLDGY